MTCETRLEAGDWRPGGRKRQQLPACQNRLVLPIGIASQPSAYTLQPPALARSFREIQLLQEPASFILST